MKWTKQRLNNLFFIVGIVAVVAMILTFDVSFVELWQHLCKAGYWLIPILGIWFLVYGLNAWAWQSIINYNTEENTQKVSFWRIYRLTITGYALNYATPVGGLGGEPYRIMELSKNIGNERATSSVILYAMMHFFAHFWLWFTSIFLYLALAVIDYVPLTPAIGACMAAAIVFCLLAFYVFSKGYKNGLVVKLIRWIGKIPGLKGWSVRFQEKHAETLRNIDAQIASLHKQDKRAFYSSLLLEYASRIVQALEILFMLLLFGIDCGGGFQGLFFTFLYSVLILSFTTLFANLIGFLPMQLGVQEGGFMLSIALIGMSTKLGSNVDSAALGIFVSIICRVREILWIFAGILLMKIDDFCRSSKVAMLLLLVAVGVFSSCSKDDDGLSRPWKESRAQRTVLVYMAGENDLGQRGYMQDDLKELIRGSRQLADNQRLLVFVDSASYDAQNSAPYILELHGGSAEVVKRYESNFLSSDPDCFREVLKTMIGAAEADSYGLVLWGHASGWIITPDSVEEKGGMFRAYGIDRSYDDSSMGEKWMNVTQMARAFSDLPKFAYIMADCCNMMCVEVGYELQHATDYLIGSPAEIPGAGAPYSLIMPFLYKDDAELYQGLIDTYYNYYKEAYKNNQSLAGYSLPMSVIDTRYVGQLATATRDIMDAFMMDYVYPGTINVHRNGTSSVTFYWYYGVPIFYDMREFLKTNSPAAAFNAWDEIFKKAVPYHVTSAQWMTSSLNLENSFSLFDATQADCGCVSMYIPVRKGISGKTDYLSSAYMNMGWGRVVDWTRYGWLLPQNEPYANMIHMLS